MFLSKRTGRTTGLEIDAINVQHYIRFDYTRSINKWHRCTSQRYGRYLIVLHAPYTLRTLKQTWYVVSLGEKEKTVESACKISINSVERSSFHVCTDVVTDDLRLIQTKFVICQFIKENTIYSALRASLQFLLPYDCASAT